MDKFHLLIAHVLSIHILHTSQIKWWLLKKSGSHIQVHRGHGFHTIFVRWVSTQYILAACKTKHYKVKHKSYNCKNLQTNHALDTTFWRTTATALRLRSLLLWNLCLNLHRLLVHLATTWRHHTTRCHHLLTWLCHHIGLRLHSNHFLMLLCLHIYKVFK